MRRRLLLAITVLTAIAGGAAEPPTLETILAKVAESQEQSQQAREKIVYTQFVHAKLLRTNGKVAREEKRTYTVTPKAKGFERKLDKFEGWYERKGQWIPYSEPDFGYKRLDIDGHLLDELIDDWTGNGDSRDGVSKDLFPLTREQQQNYAFQAKGPYQLAFAPLRKNGESEPWRGDILIDPQTLYPRSMSSTLSYQIPRAVKIIFGISLRQVGYSVNYAKAIDDLWFPVSAGTEFSLRVLFGYARTLTLSMTHFRFPPCLGGVNRNLRLS